MESKTQAGVTLNLLGGFSAEIETGVPIALPKKAQAVLAMLVVNRGKDVSRDDVASLLWSNTTSEQARHSLRQSLSILRRALNPHLAKCLTARGETLTLRSDGGFVSDVEQFERLGRSGTLADLARADSLYRGEFLAGLSLPAEPYEEWVTTERQRLLALRLRLLEAHADVLARANDLTQAIGIARRLTELDPYAEQSSRLLMQLLAASGRRGQALVEYSRVERVLREELQTEPDPGTRKLAENIRQGAPDHAEAISGMVSQPIAHHVVWDRPTICVAPFVNLTGDQGKDHFVQALTEDVAATLVREKWPVAVINPAACQVGPFLHAIDADNRYLVGGSVRQEDGRIRTVIHLTETIQGRNLWSDRIETEVGNQFALQDRLCSRIVAKLAPAVRMIESGRLARKRIESMTAYELYIHAAAICRQGRSSNARALKLLRRATDLNPELAVAYALSARCFHLQRLMGWSPPGDPQLYAGVRFAHRAIELGGSDPETLWLAGLALANIDGNAEEGQRLIDLSLSINPNNASAWIGSCFVRAHSGDPATALDHFNQAQLVNAKDNAQHVQWHAAAVAHFVAGRHEEADVATDNALRQSPDYPGALRMRIASSGLLGRIDKAQAAAQRLLRVNPNACVDSMRQYWRPWMRYTPDALADLVEGWRLAKMPDS